MWDDEITAVTLEFVLCMYWLGWIGKVYNAIDFFFLQESFGKRPLARLKTRLQDDAKIAYGPTSFDYASRWIVSRDKIWMLVILVFIMYSLLCDQKVVFRWNPHWRRLMKHRGSWQQSVTTMLRRGV